MIDHLDCWKSLLHDGSAILFVSVQDSLFCWEQWKQIPATARESWEIKFWASHHLDQIVSLLTVLEEQVAQVRLDIYGSLFGLIPHNLNQDLSPAPLSWLRDTWGAWPLKAELSYFCDMWFG